MWGATSLIFSARISAGISIHAPRVGCDTNHSRRILNAFHFNPRTPCGVRHNFLPRHPRRSNFNPRTPCGVRRRSYFALFPTRTISTHATRVGCDFERQYLCKRRLTISIHAPRVGCDVGMVLNQCGVTDFNPRTPCGVRHAFVNSDGMWEEFQSTHPVWGAT